MEESRGIGNHGVIAGNCEVDFGSDEFKRVLDSCPETTVVIEHLAGVGITCPPYTDYERALECAERPNTFIKGARPW